MRPAAWTVLLLPLAGALSCGVTPVADLPIETSFNFTNLSTHAYAVLDIRDHAGGDYYRTALLAPGATQRERFLDTLEASCPETLDLRLLLYERLDADVPIGLDADETVGDAPVAAAEILDVPACSVQTVETYTIVLWDAPIGAGRVKLAQDTRIDAAIRAMGIFPNADAAWEFAGVEASLATEAPPAAAEKLPIAGRIALADGSGVAGVGVLVRTRFRLRLTDSDAANDPDAGFGDPIDFAITGDDGAFAFARPAGAYRVEAFADDFAFRPAIVDVEAPQQAILIIAEPAQ